MLNPFKILAIYNDLNKFEGVAKENITMQSKVTQYLTLAISLFGTIGVPALATNWLHAHLLIYTIFVAAAILLHAVFPSIFSVPSAADTQATGLGKVVLVLLVFLLMPALLGAQTVAPVPTPAAPASGAPPSLFAASSEATAFHFASAWSAASHTTESFDLIDWGKTKANSFAVEGHEILAPTPGYNIFLGGGRYTPNLTNLLSKTNVPAGTFAPYFQAAIGVTSAPTSHIATLAGVGIQYRVTSSLAWSTLHAGYLRLGNQSAFEVSTGLQYFFK